MDQLNCFICNNRIQGSLDGLSNHFIRVHGLTIGRGMGNSGFECGQDGCRRRYIHFYSLRKHIKKYHLLQSNQQFEEVIVPDQDFYYDDEVVNQRNVLDDDEEAVNQRNVLEDQDNIHVHSNNENIDFDLRQLIVRMIARFQSKGAVTGTLLTEVLNEFEQVVLSMQNFLKIKVQTFFENRELLDDDEAKLVLNAFDFNNPFDGLRTLNEQIAVLQEPCNYIEPEEIPLDYRLNQILDKNTGESTNDAAFLELTEDNSKDLTIKLGPKKILLKLINSTKNLEEIIGTYAVEGNKSIAPSILQENTVSNKHPTRNQNIIQPQPHCSKDNPRMVQSSNSSCFSRYETVTKTLQNHPRGSVILDAVQSSFTEQHRKSLIRITVTELVKFHDSHYPPVSAKIALAKAIVAEFPRLRNNHSYEGYEHYYDENTKKGFIEFRLWTMRKKLSPSKKKYKITAKEGNETINDGIENLSIEEMNEKISMLKFKNPTEENKEIIIKALNDTHVFRRHWITMEKPTLTQIIQTYPRLKDYNGEMIDIEFKKIFPESKDNVILKFPRYYTPRILLYAKKFRPAVFKTSQIIKNEQLRALLILTELLPVSNAVKNKKTDINRSNNKGKKRSYSERNKEENIPLKADFPNKELLQFIPEGTNVEDFENTLRNQNNENIQPYLIFKNEQGEGISFIQGDGWLLRLPENFNALQAFEILYKFFYVFNVEYPRTLLNFYNFMDTYIYKISVKPHSVVSSLHINVCNVKMEENNSSN